MGFLRQPILWLWLSTIVPAFFGCRAEKFYIDRMSYNSEKRILIDMFFEGLQDLARIPCTTHFIVY